MHEQKGLLHPESSSLFWASSVTVQYHPFTLRTEHTLIQGCSTSLPSPEQSLQDLREARSLPQIAPATTQSTTPSWSTLGHLQLLLQHGGHYLIFQTQWLALLVFARGKLTLWSCRSVIVTSDLTNMFRVALNFI